MCCYPQCYLWQEQVQIPPSTALVRAEFSVAPNWVQYENVRLVIIPTGSFRSSRNVHVILRFSWAFLRGTTPYPVVLPLGTTCTAPSMDCAETQDGMVPSTRSTGLPLHAAFGVIKPIGCRQPLPRPNPLPLATLPGKFRTPLQPPRPLGFVMC